MKTKKLKVQPGKGKEPGEEPDVEYVEDEQEDQQNEPKEKTDSSASQDKDRRNIIIFIIVILAICAAGALIYFKVFLPMTQPVSPLPPVEESYFYRGQEFKKINGLWTTDIRVGNRLITIWIHNGPREVMDIEITGRLNTSFDHGPVYMTFDPMDESKENIALSAGELSLTIVNGVQREVIAACSRNETEACANRPIMTCEDSNNSVIYLKQSNTTSVTFDLNCITITGSEEELLRATDKLILYWYGLVPKQAETTVASQDTVVSQE